MGKALQGGVENFYEKVLKTKNVAFLDKLILSF